MAEPTGCSLSEFMQVQTSTCWVMARQNRSPLRLQNQALLHHKTYVLSIALLFGARPSDGVANKTSKRPRYIQQCCCEAFPVEVKPALLLCLSSLDRKGPAASIWAGQCNTCLLCVCVCSQHKRHIYNYRLCFLVCFSGLYVQLFIHQSVCLWNRLFLSPRGRLAFIYQSKCWHRMA